MHIGAARPHHAGRHQQRLATWSETVWRDASGFISQIDPAAQRNALALRSTSYHTTGDTTIRGRTPSAPPEAGCRAPEMHGPSKQSVERLGNMERHAGSIAASGWTRDRCGQVPKAPRIPRRSSGRVFCTRLLSAALAVPMLFMAAPVRPQSPSAGELLAFDRSKGNCLTCHEIKGGDAPGNVGPPLADMKGRFPDRKELAGIIFDETKRNPLTVMPPFGRNLIRIIESQSRLAGTSKSCQSNWVS
jgi:L-cysteine S-thiosulfotransferase